jgi:hypothetical protein
MPSSRTIAQGRGAPLLGLQNWIVDCIFDLSMAGTAVTLGAHQLGLRVDGPLLAMGSRFPAIRLPGVRRSLLMIVYLPNENCMPTLN